MDMDAVFRACASVLPLKFPLIKELQTTKEFFWFNPKTKSHLEGLRHTKIDLPQLTAASERFQRFAPLMLTLFPETIPQSGIIESPLTPIPSLQAYLSKYYQTPIEGQLFIKQDNALPISGSVKARGGIYEVLVYAERIAYWTNLLKPTDSYAKLASPKARKVFSQHSIAVGSTGNLGLSIGIMARALGLKATIHMSMDAQQWKKDKLREIGATVVEHRSDYSAAVEAGRKEAKADKFCHFVDDENSTDLFLGYAVAALRLSQQLQERGIRIDSQHPLFVYLPCGVGGAPGGITFGLKSVFGDHVHCIFVEPTHCPSMFLGVYTGLHESICVQDMGLDNITIADGLACGRPSSFVGRAMQYLIDGYSTVSDSSLCHLLQSLYRLENIFVEPSASAGFRGLIHALSSPDYLRHIHVDPTMLKNATHIVWSTGGNMVPEYKRQEYLRAKY